MFCAFVFVLALLFIYFFLTWLSDNKSNFPNIWDDKMTELNLHKISMRTTDSFGELLLSTGGGQEASCLSAAVQQKLH